MPRNKGNRGRGRGGGRGGKDSNGGSNWTPRGGHSHGNHITKRGRGGDGKHNRQNKHHHHQVPRWNWHHDQYHADNESTASDSESNISTFDFVDPTQFPRIEDNIFSILLPSSSSVSPSTAAVPHGRLDCLRLDCKRAKKDLERIRRRDRRLRQVLRLGLEQLGPGLVDFLLGGEEDDGRFDDDADSMDWVPEPTVNLIVTAKSTSSSYSPSPHVREIHCNGLLPQNQHQHQHHPHSQSSPTGHAELPNSVQGLAQAQPQVQH